MRTGFNVSGIFIFTSIFGSIGSSTTCKQQQENDYKEAFTRHLNRNVRHSMLNTIEGCKTESMVIGGKLESDAGTYVLMF